MCQDAPDTRLMQEAAMKNSDIAQQALDFYRQVYADQAPARAAATERANRVSDIQLDMMNDARWFAHDAFFYNKDTFRPLEKEMIEEARAYDTEERRDQAAGRAAGDIELAAAGARAAGARELRRIGVNPSDGAYGAMHGAADTSLALGKVDAMNKARDQVRTIGHAMKMDAVSLGRGLPAQQATQAGLALNSGNASVGNAQVPLAVANQGAALMGQGYGTAVNANNSSGNLYAQVAKMQGSEDDGLMTGLANLGMAGKYIFSDKKMKKDRKKIDTKDAVDAVEKMPVESWKYRDDSPAADGGQEHIGPMAQDVHAAAGEAAAPGGRMIDPQAVNGITLAATQQLAKDVKRLEKKVDKLAGGATLSMARRQPAEA